MKIHPFYRLFLLLTLSVLLNTNAQSQMKVELGNDTTFCYDMAKVKQFNIGNNLKIANGSEPYNFSWTCRIVRQSQNVMWAKQLLNDSTLQNPQYIGGGDAAWRKFILTVTDKNGDKAKDSINIRMSVFSFVLGYGGVSVHVGDSISIYGSGIGNGIPPIKFDHWEPSTGLVDSKKNPTWAKPQVSTLYSIVVSDSVGCISTPNQTVNVMVFPVAVTPELNRRENIIYQQKTAVYFPNEMHEPATITVFTLNGQKLFTESTTAESIELGSQRIRKGIYLVQVKLGKEKLSCKYVKQ